MNIFTIADTHFFHKNIIDHCDRPFINAEEMNEIMINNWNKNVKVTDLVYHLGDFVFKHPEEIIPRLNGRIILIKGNHDKNINKLIKYGVTEVLDYKEFDAFGKKIVLCHYPFEAWNKKHYGAIHLHGHCHGHAQIMENRFDVGVDCNNFKPINMEEIIYEW